MRRYRELLAISGVLKFTAAVTLSRFSTSMLNLALLVAMTQRYGYANAGLLLMAYALTNAVIGPIRGRLADRYAPRPVMLWLTAGHTIAYAGLLITLITVPPVPAVVVVVAALGLTVPPTGPVVRGLWPTIVPADRLATAYAFDAALNTATWITGPMIAGGLLLAFTAPVTVAVTGGVKLIGDVLVAISPTVRGHTVERRARTRGLARVFGPLVNPRLSALLGMIMLDTFGFGCLEVVAVAAADGKGSAGVFTSALSLGAVVSGISYGARTWPGGPRAQLIALHAGGAAVACAAALSEGFLLVAVAFAAYGLLNGPVETLQQVLAGDLSPPAQRIEVFAWVYSVMWAGFGIGTLVAGQLTGSGETAPPLFAAAAAQLLIALIAVVNLAGLGRTHPGDT